MAAVGGLTMKTQHRRSQARCLLAQGLHPRNNIKAPVRDRTCITSGPAPWETPAHPKVSSAAPCTQRVHDTAGFGFCSSRRGVLFCSKIAFNLSSLDSPRIEFISMTAAKGRVESYSLRTYHSVERFVLRVPQHHTVHVGDIRHCERESQLHRGHVVTAGVRVLRVGGWLHAVTLVTVCQSGSTGTGSRGVPQTPWKRAFEWK
ncbi:hypothetical protein C8Q77DRAFT_630795 [Trametes polyzona]|nr:hypothetical protein C8Q77DRAFT_630795 [Trametes polyzona]